MALADKLNNGDIENDVEVTTKLNNLLSVLNSVLYILKTKQVTGAIAGLSLLGLVNSGCADLRDFPQDVIDTSDQHLGVSESDLVYDEEKDIVYTSQDDTLSELESKFYDFMEKALDTKAGCKVGTLLVKGDGLNMFEEIDNGLYGACAYHGAGLNRESGIYLNNDQIRFDIYTLGPVKYKYNDGEEIYQQNSLGQEVLIDVNINIYSKESKFIVKTVCMQDQCSLDEAYTPTFSINIEGFSIEFYGPIDSRVEPDVEYGKYKIEFKRATDVDGISTTIPSTKDYSVRVLFDNILVGEIQGLSMEDELNGQDITVAILDMINRKIDSVYTDDSTPDSKK